MKKKNNAYLDIETTGLDPSLCSLTVIGIYFERGNKTSFHQLVGEKITAERLKKVLKGVASLYTYNGARFDLPFIKLKLGVDIKRDCIHKDLMYLCWKRNLYGGLKKVEQTLGIKRKLKDIDGWVAVKLWHQYTKNDDDDALKTLLAYNKEDSVNLAKLRKRIE